MTAQQMFTFISFQSNFLHIWNCKWFQECIAVVHSICHIRIDFMHINIVMMSHDVINILVEKIKWSIKKICDCIKIIVRPIHIRVIWSRTFDVGIQNSESEWKFRNFDLEIMAKRAHMKYITRSCCLTLFESLKLYRFLCECRIIGCEHSNTFQSHVIRFPIRRHISKCGLIFSKK